MFIELVNNQFAMPQDVIGKENIARNWYRQKAQQISVNRAQLFLDKEKGNRYTGRPMPGDMYMFAYNPKHSATLPFYDQFPVIFPVEFYRDGILGINFHYLPLRHRAVLMDNLHKIALGTDERQKVLLSYQLLKSRATLEYAKPCIKRYLARQFASQLIKVFPSEWDVALFLPVAQWAKQSGDYVHQQSLRRLQYEQAEKHENEIRNSGKHNK